MPYLRWIGSLLLVGMAGISFAETTPIEKSAGVVDSGYERFIDSCAFCHGVDGRGEGEAAAMLSKQPANLTQLAKNNGGKFPLAEVYAAIDGRDMPKSHGMREMPVWGDLWSKSVPPEYAEFYVRARILELVLFLDSIQE
jgi:mono/diheme cytochrome c family protein